MERVTITKDEWKQLYGGQMLLDAEGFDVVACYDCDDSICHGWRVIPRVKCPTCKSDPRGMFVGWGAAWVDCPTCEKREVTR